MPLLAGRGAAATERTLVYFRMNMYMRSPCVSVPAPRHQTISGRCWTRANFRHGSIATEVGGPRYVWFTPGSDRGADVDPACVVVALGGSSDAAAKLIYACSIRTSLSA